ncbi:hypothetical protein [Campylobacter rectus]|uniref:Uncharacterized protein n=1 Tax=Campylobacter rectus TaxID=203 RepID=A0A6G5QQB8_CAMRE|nr:hypothetical protein [Campylobacter rectus]QCD47784.1 hypothetical protein CRECT_2183 [Campylobacter rectus]UEB48478.1 hypothetical protein LK437_03940 [Campylobacter rectus]
MSKISNKDLISKFKDYADIADASYAMLHWVNENEDDGWFDKFKERKLITFKFIKSIIGRIFNPLPFLINQPLLKFKKL